MDLEFRENFKKNIYCPKCGRKVGTWDGKYSGNLIMKCQKCNKRIVYHCDTGEIEIKQIPMNIASSGRNFSY